MLDVFDARAAPAVNGLVIVAHHHKLAVLAGEDTQPGVLDGIGVLELVHQNMLKAALVVFEYLGVLEPQLMSAQQNLTEIDHAATITGFFVGRVHL